MEGVNGAFGLAFSGERLCRRRRPARAHDPSPHSGTAEAQQGKRLKDDKDTKDLKDPKAALPRSLRSFPPSRRESRRLRHLPLRSAADLDGREALALGYDHLLGEFVSQL